MDAHAPEKVELDPDEPKTPLWLTLLGGGLFLLTLLLGLAHFAGESEASAAAGSADAEASAAPALPPPGEPGPGAVAPGAPGSPQQPIHVEY